MLRNNFSFIPTKMTQTHTSFPLKSWWIVGNYLWFHDARIFYLERKNHDSHEICVKPERFFLFLILLFIRKNFHLKDYFVKHKKGRSDFTWKWIGAVNTSDKLCKLNVEFQQVHLAPHSLFVPIKAPTSATAPPPLSSGLSVELREQRGRYVGSLPAGSGRRNTPRPPAQLCEAGRLPRQPTTAARTGKTLLNVNFSRKLEEKKLIFSPSFMRVFFSHPCKDFERNSWQLLI